LFITFEVAPNVGTLHLNIKVNELCEWLYKKKHKDPIDVTVDGISTNKLE